MMTTHLPTVTPPRRPLPPGACDAHAHVFGPYARFPLGEVRSYTPPEATADDHQAMLDVLSFQRAVIVRSEEHTSELQSLMRISYAVFCLKKKKTPNQKQRSRDVLDAYYIHLSIHSSEQ